MDWNFNKLKFTFIEYSVREKMRVEKNEYIHTHNRIRKYILSSAKKNFPCDK